MYFLYSILLTAGFILLSPWFIFDAFFKGKYIAGLKQRLGFLPKFDAGGRRVVWLHCVSVGEANAARSLAAEIKERHGDICLVISTTTRTGQEVARNTFQEVAELVFYFPFDWQFAVRRALRNISPSVVLLMETEIWFNFIREASRSGVAVAIVNGRLSARSVKRYGYIGHFMHRVLSHVDLALMQSNSDATRLMSLGMRGNRVKVTGNLKFDRDIDNAETGLKDVFRERFGITADRPLLIAASTHEPEEKQIIEAFAEILKQTGEHSLRLMIAPRHPERFNDVAETIRASGINWSRRSDDPSSKDRDASIILLDSIGELRAAYPLAEIVFVGGSLIPHGGQSIFEPAHDGKAIITGPHTANFDAAVKEFLAHDALVQLPNSGDAATVADLQSAISELLADSEKRRLLGENAGATMYRNRGAVGKTLEYLAPLLDTAEHQ